MEFSSEPKDVDRELVVYNAKDNGEVIGFVRWKFVIYPQIDVLGAQENVADSQKKYEYGPEPNELKKAKESLKAYLYHEIPAPVTGRYWEIRPAFNNEDIKHIRRLALLTGL